MLKTRLLIIPALVALPLSLQAQGSTEPDSSTSGTAAASSVIGIGTGLFSLFSGDKGGEARSLDRWCAGPCARRGGARNVMRPDDAALLHTDASDARTSKLSKRSAADMPSPAANALEKASPKAAFNRSAAGDTDDAATEDGAGSSSGDASTLPWQAAPAATDAEWLGPVQGGNAATEFGQGENGGSQPSSFEWVTPPAPVLSVQQNVNVIVNPEPSTILLMLAGLGTLAYVRLRTRRRPG